MTRLKTLVMALVLGAMSFWYYTHSSKVELELKSKEIKALEAFASLEKEKISEISIIGTKGVLGLSQSKDGWSLKKPKGAAATGEYVELLLEAIQNLTPENEINSELVSENQSIYGLTPPQIIVTVKGDFKKRVFSFGKKNKISGGRYFQLENDSSIYLMPETLFSVFDKTSKEVRETLTLRTPVEKINSIVVQADGREPFILTKVKAGAQEIPTWNVKTSKDNFFADGDLIRSSLQKLVMIQAEEFIDNGASRLPFFGLSKPLLTLRIGSEEDKGKGLFSIFGKGVAATSNEKKEVGVGVAYYQKIAGKPWIYKVQREAINSFVKGADAFRAKQPFANISEPDVGLLFIRTKDSDIRISRTALGAKWKLETKEAGNKAFEEKSLNSDRLSEWLEKFFSLKVVSFESEALNKRSSKPYLEIRFTLFSSEVNITSGRLKVGEPLKSANATNAEEGAPRNSIIRIEKESVDNSNTRSEIGAIISSKSIAELNLPPDFFLKDR